MRNIKKCLLSILFLLLTFATCYQVAARHVQTVIYTGTDGKNYLSSGEVLPEQTILDFLSSLPDNPCGTPNFLVLLNGRLLNPLCSFGEYPELSNSRSVLRVIPSQNSSTTAGRCSYLKAMQNTGDVVLVPKNAVGAIMRLRDMQQVRMESSPKRLRRLASKTTSEQENPTQGSDSQLGQTTITQPGVGELSVDPLPAPW